ncbi:MAG: IclR family transcriptional regulator C-terminal domain-containing protein [Streptosporangiaceae bacterium]
MQQPAGPLERGLQAIEVLARTGAGLRPADLARETGLARSSVDRIVTTLVRLGYLRWAGREVVLAPHLMELGNAYLAGIGMTDALAAHATGLADTLEESVSLAVPDRCDVRFISQSPRRRTMSVAFRVGDLLPAERCAPGALFAADWEPARWQARPGSGGLAVRAAAAREDGWALDDQLVEPGLIAVAVPVRHPDGTSACALSVVSHTSRHSIESLRRQALPAMLDCAARMAALLAGPRAAGSPAEGPALDRSRAAKEALGPEFLQSLDRGLAVLHALGSVPGGRTLSEAAAVTGLPRATARRAVLSLEQLGYVAAGGRRFVLLPRVLDLGYAALSGSSFEEVARPHLVRLVTDVRDSASMSVLDGTDIRYVVRIPTVRIMRVEITVGTRFPAYATSMGRVLLAGLPREQAAARLAATDVRTLTSFTRTGPREILAALAAAAEEGFALVDQELEEGLRSLSVPVRARDGRVVAAINVASHAGRSTPAETLERLLPALRATAAAIEADLAVRTEHNPLPAA